MGGLKRLGAAGLVAAVPSVGVVLARYAATALKGGHPGSWSPDQAVTTTVAILGAIAAGYLTVTAIPLVFAGRSPSARKSTERHVPRAWRALVALTLGLGASATSATVAMAVSPNWGAVTDHVDPWSVEWGAATPTSSTPTSAATISSPPPFPSPSPATHVVVPGDSLWRIAQSLLPTGASNADITRTWQTIYAANRDTIGSNPGLIYPGQVLTLPPEVRR